MSEKIEILQDKVLNEYGKKPFRELEIPPHITQNLSKDLREYQIEALKYYLANDETFKKNHLMFNMATGSGKTLIMAALMLDCFKKGFSNFIFFVDKTQIVEKTKANFSDKKSNKYLFAQNINIEGQNVEINTINNLNSSKKGFINIYFTTVQSLYSLLTNERENALTLQDLKNIKLVFLADEAHHLNTETKKGKKEDEIKEGWQGVINEAFNSHKENLMFEFSATIPKFENVLEKYKDKIIYEYDLAKFCKEGFSKRIFLMKYESRDIKERFLGGILMSVFRELIAFKHNISLKPVILFKSQSIQKSKDNHALFLEFIQSLYFKDIETFYANLDSKDTLLKSSLKFFENHFREDIFNKLSIHIKASFKENFIINTNDDKELENNQILLNNLEYKDNLVRVIFAVDKLNEGWDVLNLFDIVRLDDSKAKGASTKEAQLIGRGARYYPFLTQNFSDEMKYKRKFDSDLDNELSNLERLNYHTVNDVEFIKQLDKTMEKQGLFIELEKKKITLKPNEKILEKIKNEEIYYVKNDRFRKKGLFKSYDKAKIQTQLRTLKVPLFSNEINEEEKFKDLQNENKFLQDDFTLLKNLNENIDEKYFLKAMNKLGMSFDFLQKQFNFTSKSEFIKQYLGQINILFHKKQKFNSAKVCLNLSLFILENFKNLSQKISQEYEIKPFRIYPFKMGEREILTQKENEKILEVKKYEWLYYHDKMLKDSNLEVSFLEFIEGQKERLNQSFEKWFVLRNESFNEFKIYDNRLDGEIPLPTYAMGFEPDFILFAKRREDESFFGIECFIEAKGEHLAGSVSSVGADSWKEELLKEIDNKKFKEYFTDKKASTSKDLNKPFILKTLPFFKGLNDEKFEEAFLAFLKDEL